MDNFINTLSDMFYKNSKPSILFEKEGHNCIFNLEAERLFGIPILDDITELFPTIDLSIESGDQSCKKINSDVTYPFDIKYFQETRYWLLEIKDSLETEWDNFVTSQKMLHVLFLDLLSINDEKDLYKALVTKAKKILNIDRMGIILYNKNTNMIHGSWGTNETGEIIDQSYFSTELNTTYIHDNSLDIKNYVVYNDNARLFENGEPVGTGWNTKSTFYSGHEPVGWICCDNLLSNKPLPKWKKEILGELSRMTGAFIFNLRLENHLKKEVERKTIEINQTIKKLKETQENLIQAEKLASLGTLISGVAHEINTPIGVALTGVSFIEETTTVLQNKIKNNQLKKRDLDEFVQNNLYSSNLTVSSLKKASELVNIFKQLSVDQESNNIEETNIATLVDNVLMSLKYTSKLNNIKIDLNIDKSLSLNCNPSNLYQIFTHLINNSLIHGFINTGNHSISIIGNTNNGSINIDYLDNGIGIPYKKHKKIFEPFYTTNRAQGNTGLGLSIVHNSVLKIGGLISLIEKNKGGVHFNIQFQLQGE